MFTYLKSTLFALLIICFLISCIQKEENKQNNTEKEVLKQYHEGKLQSEYIMVNGVREGLGKCYYSNGKLSTTCNYSNNAKNGVENKYYYNGKIYRTREFVNGKFTGIEKRFYENGKLMTELNYKNGMPGTGLQEYSVYGKLLTTYPELILKVIHDRDYTGQKLLIFYFSDHHKNVSFYRGALIEGKYYNNNASPCGINKGVGEIGFDLAFVGDITISAKYVTSNRVPYIVEKSIHID